MERNVWIDLAYDINAFTNNSPFKHGTNNLQVLCTITNIVGRDIKHAANGDHKTMHILWIIRYSPGVWVIKAPLVNTP